MNAPIPHSRVGVAGLGRMGSIFAVRLLNAGFDVGVWNRTSTKVGPLTAAGATAFETPAKLVSACDAVIVSVADEQAQEAIFGSEEGFLSADLVGRILIETSTVSPQIICALAPRVAASGGELIDAPILGTTGPAREGKVVVLASGREQTVDRIRPIFEPIGRKTVYTGEIGSAAAMKLVVNMHLVTYWQSLAESMAMGHHCGLATTTMLDVLMDSPMATPALAAKLELICGKSQEIGFDIAGVCNVMKRALALADLTGVAAPTAQSAMKAFRNTEANGRADHDVVEIIQAAIQGIS